MANIEKSFVGETSNTPSPAQIDEFADAIGRANGSWRCDYPNLRAFDGYGAVVRFRIADYPVTVTQANRVYQTNRGRTLDNRELIEKIRELGPWHHDIELNDEVHTGKVFSPTGTLPKNENDGVTLISPRTQFTNLVKGCFPDGLLEGKSFLDCACNGGAYCFLAREFGASRVVGFDVREHWIAQAKFAQENRQTAPVDNIKFDVMDLYDLPGHNLEPFDFTYFSGIFYHLPDPVTGLKIAADLTRDVLFVSTAGTSRPDNPTGLSMSRESVTRPMSGVYEMSWFPNGPECIQALLNWLGFPEVKLIRLVENPNNRIRMSIVAAREEGRLKDSPWELMPEVKITTNRKQA